MKALLSLAILLAVGVPSAHAQTVGYPLWQNTYSTGSFGTPAYIPEGPRPPSNLTFQSEITGGLYFIVNRNHGRLMPRDQFGRHIVRDGRTLYYILGLRLGNEIILTSVQRLH